MSRRRSTFVPRNPVGWFVAIIVFDAFAVGFLLGAWLL